MKMSVKNGWLHFPVIFVYARGPVAHKLRPTQTRSLKMKKAVSLCMCIAVLMLIACSKDNENTNLNGSGSGGGNNSGKYIARVTIVDDHGYSPMSLRFDWNNDQLSHIYEYEDGYLLKDALLSYNGTLLSSMFVYNYDRHSSNMIDFVYNAGRLNYIEEHNSGRLVVQYDGSNPTRIGDNHGGISLTWLDGIICQVRSLDNDINATVVEYDNNNNPMNELFSIFFPDWNKSLKNPKRLIVDEEMVNVFYEYDGNCPSIATATKDNGFIKIYFEYTDGTGTVAPVNFKNRGKNESKASLALLPPFLL